MDKIYMALGIVRLSGIEGWAAGAAMPPMLLHRATTGVVERVPLSGMFLGTDFNVPRVVVPFSLESGDRALLLSDGFLEQVSPTGEEFDYEGATACFLETAGMSPEASLDHLFARFDAHRGPVPQADDVTLFLVTAKP
jgi:serine phosphatase RsbU (regulator of sigma subunit)